MVRFSRIKHIDSIGAPIIPCDYIRIDTEIPGRIGDGCSLGNNNSGITRRSTRVAGDTPAVGETNVEIGSANVYRFTTVVGVIILGGWISAGFVGRPYRARTPISIGDLGW